MSVQGEIDRLNAAKNTIGAALETMGVLLPPGAKLDCYASQLTAIAAGGGQGGGRGITVLRDWELDKVKYLACIRVADLSIVGGAINYEILGGYA